MGGFRSFFSGYLNFGKNSLFSRWSAKFNAQAAIGQKKFHGAVQIFKKFSFKSSVDFINLLILKSIGFGSTNYAQIKGVADILGGKCVYSGFVHRDIHRICG